MYINILINYNSLNNFYNENSPISYNQNLNINFFLFIYIHKNIFNIRKKTSLKYNLIIL